MYYIKQTPSDPRLLEMQFDCTNYQAQFPKDKPFEDHVFQVSSSVFPAALDSTHDLRFVQTIFLNKKDQETWSKSEINKGKIIREDWWHQVRRLARL